MNHIMDVKLIDMAKVPVAHFLTVGKERGTPVEIKSVTLAPIKATESSG
jgi:hypothetical protein